MYYFPEGTKIFYSETFAAPKSVTGISNADPAVASAVAHGLLDNDPVLLTSGWEDSNDTIFEIDSLSADTFGVLGLDSTDTNWFPPGTGGGTAKKVSLWTEMPQVLTIQAQGGGPKYGTISPLASRNDKRQVIGFEASSIDVTMGWDPASAALKKLNALTRSFKKLAIKLVLPGGGRVYGYGNIAASEVPQLSKGNAITVSAGISIDGRVISYGT